MIKLCCISLMLLFFSACSEDAQPYKEISNISDSNEHEYNEKEYVGRDYGEKEYVERGYIDTH